MAATMLRRLAQLAAHSRRRGGWLAAGAVGCGCALLFLPESAGRSPLSPLCRSLSSASASVSASAAQPSRWMSESVSPSEWVRTDSSAAARMELLCMEVQAELCRAMEQLDGEAKFVVDKWQRPSGGGGISCVMSDGAVFERAGVNISAVNGTLSQEAVRQMNSRPERRLPEGRELPFTAVGISCVVHPRSPHVPIMHFNYRYFEVDDGAGGRTWWYGGGNDLTPIFLEREDAVHFHKTLKDTCDKHGRDLYPRFKKWCDDYFFIRHRNERRGVGGIFFDDLDKPSQEAAFAFVTGSARAVGAAYLPIVRRNMHRGYSYADRQWQLLRRGRYVEFNLVYDRGTKFGLYTKDARIESILMSLPPLARWEYCHDADADPVKAQLMRVLRNPQEWV